MTADRIINLHKRLVAETEMDPDQAVAIVIAQINTGE